MTTTTIQGFVRDDGQLRRVELLRIDGQLCDPYGQPLTETPETTELFGWGEDDGTARVYHNAGGREVLVPTR